jgi:hypothetical protein
MYVERVPNRNSPPAVLLRESYRDGSKIKKRTLANLADWPTAKVEALRRVLRDEPVATMGQDGLSILRSLPHGHVAAALGKLRKLGVDRLLSQGGRQPLREVALCTAMIVARLIDPASKLATARGLDGETASTSLGQVLDLGEVDERELYATLDWLVGQQARIEKSLARRHLHDGTWFSTTSPQVISKAALVRWPNGVTTATASEASCKLSSGCSARPKAARSRSRSSKVMSATLRRWQPKSTSSNNNLDSSASCLLVIAAC